MCTDAVDREIRLWKTIEFSSITFAQMITGGQVEYSAGGGKALRVQVTGALSPYVNGSYGKVCQLASSYSFTYSVRRRN